MILEMRYVICYDSSCDSESSDDVIKYEKMEKGLMEMIGCRREGWVCSFL
jgi:hypothetical protein